MQDHDRRSLAGSPPSAAPPLKLWQRPRALPATAPMPVLLVGRDIVVPDLEAPEPLSRLDHTMLLPCEARRDLIGGAL